MTQRLTEKQMAEVARIQRAVINIARLTNQVELSIKTQALPLQAMSTHEIGRFYGDLEDLIMRNEKVTEIDANTMRAIEQECREGRIS